MERYNASVMQHLKWLQNEAPNITSLVTKKADWMKAYHEDFWKEWEVDVFQIETANSFGLALWCIILGVSSDLFDFTPAVQRWAFGAKRENFIYNDAYHTANPLPTEKQSPGGNFGSEGDALTSLDDIRMLLKFRYATLVSSGRIHYMNRMMNWILNKGEPWDVSNERYAYALDNTSKGTPLSAAIWISDWQGMREITTGTESGRIEYLLYNTSLAPSDIAISKSVLTNLSVNQDVSSAPDGSVTADKIAPDATDDRHSLTLDTEPMGDFPSSSVDMTFSIFLKEGELSSISVEIVNTGSGLPDNTSVYNTVDLSNRAIGGGGSAYLVSYPNNWVRLVIPYSAGGGYTGSKVNISFIDNEGNSQFIGDPSKGIYLWGWMLEISADFNDFVKVDNATGSNAATVGPNNVTSAGVVSFGRVPPAGAGIYWSGSWGLGSYTNPHLIATANGTLNSFQIAKPANDGALITQPNYIEFRFGKNVAISDTLIQLMNNRENGLIFQNACVTYKVVQES